MSAPTQIPVANHTTPDHRFRQMFEATAVGTAICDFDGRILEANPALEGMLGYERKGLVSVNLWKFHVAEGLAANSPSVGSSLPALQRGEGGPFSFERRYRRTNGPEFWGLLTISLARDFHGEPAFVVALLEDATERRRLEENLRQAEKMEVIGQLAGGIAHDFNNLLTGILLYSELLLENLAAGDPIRRYVEEVRMAGEQGAALTQQLLTMARKQKVEPRPILINEVVSSTGNLLRRLIGEQIILVTELDPSAGLVLIDPPQLRQVLLNLVVNARDATQRGGTIRLSTRATQLPGTPGTSKCQPVASIVVEDNGCGMNAETRARIFEPFFTTKKPGEGTGMGLATVQHIVSEAGGWIQVATAPQCGTRIEVLLPAFAVIAKTQVLDSPILEVSNRKGGSRC